ncbi:MAG: glyoxalase/bleomycin resistance/extradiol dioxygenase family protein [Caulobacter sp.]|nr:glyoxalase/bleomycin resistance/extradiol dioxygenase family protein [Caulobacter sp.]
MTDTQPPALPPVSGGIVPYLQPSNATAAAEFYAKAFGAEVLYQIPPDEHGRTMHIHLRVNGNSLMLSDAYPDHGHPLETPGAFTLHMQVDDVDAWFDRAAKAGCQVLLPVQLMFWGDRYGQLKDPYGFSWSIATTPAKP